MNKNPWFHWLQELPDTSIERAGDVTWKLSLFLLVLACLRLLAWIQRDPDRPLGAATTPTTSAVAKLALYVACLRPWLTWLLCGPHRPPITFILETQWLEIVGGLLVLRMALVAARREMPDLFL
jgi:hypothetical protein